MAFTIAVTIPDIPPKAKMTQSMKKIQIQHLQPQGIPGPCICITIISHTAIMSEGD